LKTKPGTEPLSELCDLYESVYVGSPGEPGCKSFSDEYLKAVGPLGLAIWYEDDFSFSVRPKGPQRRTEEVSGYATVCLDAMDAKTRELIAVAVSITLRCDGCITVHTDNARKLGATQEEVAEALGGAGEIQLPAAGDAPPDQRRAVEPRPGAGQYGLSRWGMEPFRASPRQSDLLIVSGRVSQKMAPPLRRIYDQMPEPRWVIAMGVWASAGGMFTNYAIVQGVDTIVPVDVYVPGCPPKPEMLMFGILKQLSARETDIIGEGVVEVVAAIKRAQ